MSDRNPHDAASMAHLRRMLPEAARADIPEHYWLAVFGAIASGAAEQIGTDKAQAICALVYDALGKHKPASAEVH